MTIFTWLHFCLKEQMLALLNVPDKQTFGKGKTAQGRKKTSRAKGLKTGGKAAGSTQSACLLPSSYYIFHLSRGVPSVLLHTLPLS